MTDDRKDTRNMDIGLPRRIIEVVPEPTPVPEPVREPEQVPA